MKSIVAYLNGLPPIGVLRDRQAKVNALPALRSSGRLQSPPLHFGDCRCFARRSQSPPLRFGDGSQSASEEQL
jgi:hypothetical protein